MSDIADVIALPLPLDGWHRARGARMAEFAGYHMPIDYEGIIAEHVWTRASAGLFDVSHMGQLLLSGEGVAQAFEMLVPGNIVGLMPGRVRYSLLMNHNGGIRDDFMITNRGNCFYLVVNGAVKWDDIAYLREYLPDEITITHLDEYALLALQGPKAATALHRLGIMTTEAKASSPTDLFFMEAGLFEWNGVPLAISRSGYTGEDGFEISVPDVHAIAVADALCAQSEVKPIGLGARDSLRLEAGLPLYGHDLDETIDPVSAGLTFAIAKQRRAEGRFAGADVVNAYLANGTPRVRIGFIVDGKQPARAGAAVFAGDQPIGTVTSGGFSPSLETPIGMAYVDCSASEAGHPIEIEVRGKRIGASVSTMPFIPHQYRRKGTTV